MGAVVALGGGVALGVVVVLSAGGSSVGAGLSAGGSAPGAAVAAAVAVAVAVAAAVAVVVAAAVAIVVASVVAVVVLDGEGTTTEACGVGCTGTIGFSTAFPAVFSVFVGVGLSS